MLTENKTIKSLGYYKRKMKVLNKSLLKFIQKDIWPFTNFVLKQKTISFIEEIQYTIAYLKLLNKSSEALRYVEYFSFSLSNRLLSIESIRTKSSRNIFGMDKMIIANAYDFKTCFSLVLLTHPKNIKTSLNLEVKYVEIKKKDFFKTKVLGICNIVDCVLQLQMLTFLDPLIDMILPENFYGFRKGRSPLQAVAYLSNSISFSDTFRYHLVFVDLCKFFDSISHEFILNKFPFPMKYKNLLRRWIKCVYISESCKKIKMLVGVPQGSILGLIICNFTFAYITKNFFEDPFFSKNLKSNNRFFLSYIDNLIIKVISSDEASYALKKLKNKLFEAGLKIYNEESSIYDLSIQTKFDWLGYTFLVKPKKSLKYSKLVHCKKKFISEFNKNSQTVLLLYISHFNFIFIKKRLKEEIKNLKHKCFLSVLRKVNLMLKSIISYYGFITMRHCLNYLQSFVNRIFWRTLVEKYRYKGIRRPGWVAKTFFVTTISPLGLKWHLHFSISGVNNLKNKNANFLWCVHVCRFFKLQPINIYLLTKKLRINSFYLFKEEFNIYRFRIQERRVY